METETITPEVTSSDSVNHVPRDYNEAVIRRYALKVSEETRAGKYTRVSEQFIIDVEAEVEALLRKLRQPAVAFNGKIVDVPEGEEFLTGAGKKKLAEATNIAIASIIHRKTKDIRTGKTF